MLPKCQSGKDAIVKMMLAYLLTVTSFFQKDFPSQFSKNSMLSAVGKAAGCIGSEPTIGITMGACPAARPNLSGQILAS